MISHLEIVDLRIYSFVPRTTDSRHPYPISPNLLQDRPLPKAINQVIVGDITHTVRRVKRSVSTDCQMKKSLQTRCSLIYTLSVEFPAITKIDFLVQQILAVVQFKRGVST